MKGYNPNPGNSAQPYKNMLADIYYEIESATKRDKLPTYVIINSNDLPFLQREMNKANILPEKVKPGKLQLRGIRIIQTPDIPQGFFDVVWN